MQKILLGYEQLDPDTMKGWNLNGRIHQGSTKKNHVFGNEFYDMIYKCLIKPQDWPDSHKLTNPLFNSCHSVCHDSVCLQNLSSDQTYFYPIMIKSLHFYVDMVENIELSDKARSDIEFGQAYLLFVYHHEGDLHYVKKKFYDLIDKLKLPKHKILFVHANQSQELFQDAPFEYVPVDIFAWWLSDYRSWDSILTYKPEKLFLTYSRQVRFHRLCLFASLIKHNVLDQGIVSCGKFRFGLPAVDLLKSHNYQLSTEEIKILENLELQSPDGQVQGNDINNCPNSINFADHEKTFVSLVAETLSDSVFLSEKTYKPLAIGHPFIILGGSGHLAYLKKQGYRTFSQYWNEDYDQEPDLYRRIDKITHVIKNLNLLTTQERIDMRNDMLPILRHNKDLFQNSMGNINFYLHDQTMIMYRLVDILNSKNV